VSHDQTGGGNRFFKSGDAERLDHWR
jgi:hypothetical protein